MGTDSCGHKSRMDLAKRSLAIPSTIRRKRSSAGRCEVVVNPATSTMPNEPSAEPTKAIDAPFEDDIARLAYRYYEDEGRPEGQHEAHWHRAEQVLRGVVPPWTVESGAGDA